MPYNPDNPNSLNFAEKTQLITDIIAITIHENPRISIDELREKLDELRELADSDIRHGASEAKSKLRKIEEKIEDGSDKYDEDYLVKLYERTRDIIL